MNPSNLKRKENLQRNSWCLVFREFASNVQMMPTKFVFVTLPSSSLVRTLTEPLILRKKRTCSFPTCPQVGGWFLLLPFQRTQHSLESTSKKSLLGMVRQSEFPASALEPGTKDADRGSKHSFVICELEIVTSQCFHSLCFLFENNLSFKCWK